MGRPAKYPVETLPAPEIYHYGPEIDRQTARSLGLVRYFTGLPCCHNHVEERWVASGTCIQCVLQRHRTEEYREYATPVQRDWVAANPDRVEDYNAQRRAVKAAKPVKSEARRESCRAAWVERKAKTA